MGSLERLTIELRDLKGGELLRTLKTASRAGGDEASRKLHTFLFHEVWTRSDAGDVSAWRGGVVSTGISQRKGVSLSSIFEVMFRVS